MRKQLTRIAVATALIALPVALAACGGGGGGGGNNGFATGKPVKGKKGGTLTVLSASDVDHIDPGAAYYQFTYLVTYATQRPLYSFKPDNLTKADPDSAAADPKVSADGKTITIPIKKGIKYSPPYNKEVTAADVKYAIERGTNPSVANGYEGSYFGNVEGFNTKGKPFSGITTPDKNTLQIKLTKPTAGLLIGALSLPLTAPVPQAYAKKFDSKKVSDYGTHQLATGPYMIQNDKSGKSVGYVPTHRITLVRNPNWVASTDYRPAYLDKVVIDEGNTPDVAARRIIKGSSLINGDFPPPPAVLKSIVTQGHKSQVTFAPLGNRYVALNNAIPPFNNENLRKAVSAALDRTAMIQTRGGPLVGDLATHYISPGVPGYDEAGGAKGPGVDFLAKPEGDMALATKYMKAAGFKSGKYSGPAILVVGDNESPGKETAQVVQRKLQELGFKLNFRLVPHDAMYTNFCNVPKKKVQVCTNVGWLPDFIDPEAFLLPTFDGKNITQTNNSNWSQLNDPQINSALEKLSTVSDPSERAKLGGQIDDMVTKTATAVPWIWDKQANIESKNVNAVTARWNAEWDLNFTSLK